jgi:DNA mismatch endonuclease (patch repair protein)
MDRISKEHRSWNMSRIKGKDTKPELIVRSILHKMGYRFRLNGKVSKKYHPKGVLPGKPDIVLAKYKTVIFVHGCFWHQHEGCMKSHIPKSNTEYWKKKLEKNVKRDIDVMNELTAIGMNSLVIWECELSNTKKIQNLVKKIQHEKK